jgi:hypothetical protein
MIRRATAWREALVVTLGGADPPHRENKTDGCEFVRPCDI